MESDLKDKKTIDTSPGRIMAHMDVIKTLHFPIPDTPENRKMLEAYICTICAKIQCTGIGRCRVTAMTMAQINLLTAVVTIRDEGSRELGIEGFDRVITIGEALRPFNPMLADYFGDDDIQELHAIICLAKSKNPNISLGTLKIPKEYNIKTNKLLDRTK